MRQRRAAPRRGPLREPQYLQYLRDYGACAGCHRADKPCDPAHGPVNGMSSKGPDNEAVPLCRECHDYQAKLGWPAFEKQRRVDRKAVAARWWENYQKHIAVYSVEERDQRLIP